MQNLNEDVNLVSKKLGAVLITGATSGIGRAISLHLAASGFDVVATGRSSDKLSRLSLDCEDVGSKLRLYEMDVRDPCSIKKVRSSLRKVDVQVGSVINNAGFGLWGPVFHIKDDEISDQFDTNLFGPIRVNRMFLEDMIKNKNGRIINIGSVLGRFASPFNGSYVASKFALDGLSRCLRMELAPFGIHVSLVEPGLFDTDFKANQKVGMEVCSGQSPYEEMIVHYRKKKRYFRKGSDPDAIARLVKKILLSNKPKARYSVGIDAKLSLLLNSLLPNSLFDYLVSRATIGR